MVLLVWILIPVAMQVGETLAALIRRSSGRDNKSLAAFAEALAKITEKFNF